MEIEIVTKQDLENFRQKLLHDLAEFFSQAAIKPEKEFLRTSEVRKMLGGISPGTLQNLRVKGLLNPSKIEGVYYYKLSEVKALLSAGSREPHI
jgi:hypothetical protein